MTKNSVDYGNILSCAFKQDMMSNKSLFRFAVSFVELLVLALLFFVMVVPVLQSINFSSIINPIALISLFIPVAVAFLVVFIIFWVIDSWISVSIIHMIHQEYLGKSVGFGKALSFGKGRLLPFLVASLLVNILAFLVQIIPIPILNIILMIIWGLMTFLVFQYVIVGKTGGLKAIGESINFFMSNKLIVFVLALLMVLVAILIILLFGIVLLSIYIMAVIGAISGVSPNALKGSIGGAIIFSSIYGSLMANIWILFIGFVLLTFGGALAEVFSMGVQTRLYLSQVEGKKAK